jgi:RNA polymerase sigma-70 factor (ECF subfamily)
MEAHEVISQVWTELHANLERFVAKRVDDPSDVEDLLQALFLRLHQGLAQGAAPAHLRGWVYESARHAIADFYRVKGRRREAPSGTMDDLGPLGPSEPSSADLTTHRPSLASCVPHFLRQLPDAYREALEMTALQGLAQGEAAARVGLSVPGMKARVQRGRKQLRAALLDCCDVALDPRGGVVSYQPRPGQTHCS